MAPDDALLSMTSRIVSLYSSRNEFGIKELPDVIRSVHATLLELRQGSERTIPGQDIQPRREDSEDGLYRDGIRTYYDDRIVCLEDRKEVVFLTRHLHRLGMSPEQYRSKWRLPASYPMVAPDYAAQKRTLAIAAGLGRAGGIRPGKSDIQGEVLGDPSGVPLQRRRRRTGRLSPAYGSA